MSISYEQCKSLLQSTDPSTGQSLYHHLIHLLQSIVSESNKENSLVNGKGIYNEFERLSLEIKKNYYPALPLLPSSSDNNKNHNADSTGLPLLQDLCHINQQPTHNPLLDILSPDLLCQFQLLQQAGIYPLTSTSSSTATSTPTVQIYTLQLSIRQFIQKKVLTDQSINTPKYTDIRFWGIIRGMVQDYYVIEMKVPYNHNKNNNNINASPVSPNDVKVEVEGTGLNEYIYYITNNYLDSSSWTQLPLLRPEYIIESRKIHRYFTGHLNASVPSLSPQWKYSEAELLRAMIQRITSSTLIAPRGIYSIEHLDDESQSEILTPDFNEYEPMSVEELAGQVSQGNFPEDWSVDDVDRSYLENWQHIRPHVLKQGRASVYVAPEKEEDEDGSTGEEDQKDEKTAEELEYEEEEVLPLLTSIADDIDTLALKESHVEVDVEELQRDQPVWCFRVYPNTSTAHGVVVGRNTLWNGAYTVVKNDSKKRDEFVNIYVGYGIKSLGTRFYQPRVTDEKFVDEYKLKNEEEDDDEEEDQPRTDDPYILKEQQDPLPPVLVNNDGEGQDNDDHDEQDDDESNDED